MQNLPEIAHQMERDGFAILPRFIDEWTCKTLAAAIDDVVKPSSSQSRRSGYALRNLLQRATAVKDFIQSSAVYAAIHPLLGAEAFAVRGLFFDKVAGSNWKVSWHQDATIAVAERADVPGFGPWSQKEGIPHVEPPVAVLERMVALRVHLDETDDRNGPLRVIPGSHRVGRLSRHQIDQYREREPSTCLVPQGGAMLMHPLLLHASSPAESPTHRRVIHLEFASAALPEPLRWHEQISLRSS